MRCYASEFQFTVYRLEVAFMAVHATAHARQIAFLAIKDSFEL